MKFFGRLINYLCMVVVGFSLGAIFVGYLLDDNSHFWMMFFLILVMVALVIIGEMIDKPEKEYIYIPHCEIQEDDLE